MGAVGHHGDGLSIPKIHREFKTQFGQGEEGFRTENNGLISRCGVYLFVKNKHEQTDDIATTKENPL